MQVPIVDPTSNKTVSCSEYAMGTMFMGKSITEPFNLGCQMVCSKYYMKSKGVGCSKDGKLVCRCSFLG